MILKPHENPKYQEFLTSDLRVPLVPESVYLNLLKIKNFRSSNILDFGCGAGYVSLLLGGALQSSSRSHIYACDYQEDLIDRFWKEIVRKDIKNVTPFFHPDRSHISFPGWLPGIDHLIFSFSLSAVEDAYTVLDRSKSVLREEALIHIIDWEQSSVSPFLKDLYGPENRLTFMILQQWLELTGYDVIETNTDYENIFYIRAVLARP